jgi:polar amino acid transport system substrate-binding protein
VSPISLRGATLVAASLVAACAPHEENDGPDTLLVGSTSTGVPFTFLDVESGSPRGVMVDVIEAIGTDAGFSPEIQMLPFHSLIPSLMTKRIRLIAAAMLITEERERVIDFSDPVYRYGEGLVVPVGDERPYRTLGDLKGEVVGALVGTIYVDGLRDSGLFAEVRAYDSIADILRDVGLGRLKAGFGDYPILAHHLGEEDEPAVRLVRSYEPRFVGEVGIGVLKRDEELLSRVNESLARLKADGTLARILATWGLE